jgi:signal-transduction protein with cAMP-binding, CBS, and nucleotidyltransferase domain
MPPASTEQPATISAVQWQALLGENLPEQNLNWLNGRLRINEVPPGRTFWHSNSGATGLYIVLAGKVRLFDDQGEKLAVLEVGDTFGTDSLFPQRQLAGHSAKAALIKNSNAAIVGVILAADIEKLWQKFPKIAKHLGQHRQLESTTKLPGELGAIGAITTGS